MLDCALALASLLTVARVLLKHLVGHSPHSPLRTWALLHVPGHTWNRADLIPIC